MNNLIQHSRTTESSFPAYVPPSDGPIQGSRGTEVRVIRRTNDLILVQWEEVPAGSGGGVPKRAWVTPAMVVADSGTDATVVEPERGIPYGVEFSRLLDLQTTPEQIDRELKRRGIWTVADLRARPNEALSAIQAAYGTDLAALLQAAKRYEDEVGARSTSG